MSLETTREQVITKYKALAAVQGVLGAGLLLCGILGTSFTQGDDYIGPPYFIGGYLLGIMNLGSAMLASCIVVKGGDKELSDTNKREVGCAMTGHYMLAMFSIMLCFISLIFAGIFGTSYDSDEYDTNDDEDKDDSKNHYVAYAIIACCIASLFATIFSMYLLCTFGTLFGVNMTRGRRGRMVINLNTNTVHTNPSTFSTQTNNTAQMEQLRTQNLLLQQQLTLQQQQLLMQQQQQGFSGGQPLPPPPSYNSVLSDPSYPPPNPAFPSAPDPPTGFKQY